MNIGRESDDSLPWFLTHDNPEELYRNGSYLVLDFETTNLDKGSALTEDNDIILACWQVWADGELKKRAQCFGGIYEQQELLDDIGKVDFVVAQNLKFELQWLKRCGLELRDALGYDTMLAAWVLDGNKKNNRSLEALAVRHGLPGKIDLVARLIKQGVDPASIPRHWLAEYCHADVEATRRIFLAQQPLLTKAKQWHLVHVRNLTCSVLADIEFAGMYLDPERVNAEYIKAVGIRDTIGAELANLTGGINLNSPKQLCTYLYDVLGFEEAVDYRGETITTSSGDKSASAPTLAKLLPKTDEQRRFLQLYKEYNKQVSLLEKNLEYFKLTCEQKDCKFYGSFNQNVVQTHRLSSSGRPVLFKGLKKPKSVQFQNLPREYKKLFWSGDKDWVVFEADSAQVEFRVAADMGHDDVAIKEIEEGADIHSMSAKVMTEAGEPTSRQDAKAVTFRPLYGGGSGSEALKEYCKFFKEKYKGISAIQRTWALQCVDRKQFTTPYGLTFFFPDTRMNRNGYINNTTNIYNYPVQGFATGEIIPIALVYFWHRTKHLPVDIFSTIHDSIVCRVLGSAVGDVAAAAKQALTHDVYDFLRRVYKYEFRTPLGLGMKSALHWGEGKETKLDVFPDGREVAR